MAQTVEKLRPNHAPIAQPHRQDRALRLVVGALIGASVFLAHEVAVHGSEPCNPPNVIPRDVCDFDSFRGSPPRQIPNGWTEFILSGNPSYESHHDTFWGPPSLMIRSSSPFKAGVYTQVSVTPGAGYRASLAWGAPTNPDSFGRQLGIDPTGGVDPNSPNVIWGPMHWGDGRILNYPPPDVNIDVKARALGDTITVFFLVDHPRMVGDDLIFVDALALLPDESAPAVEIPPTNTPEPPPPAAPVAVAAAPTATTQPTATWTPTAMPTATPQPTATATFTPSPSPTPSPTFTPTWTPWPTITPAGLSLDALQDQARASAATGLGSILLIVGMASFGGAGLFGGLLWRMRRGRRGRRSR